MLPVPYSFQSPALPAEQSQPLQEGQRQGVHFTFPAEHAEYLLGKLRTWFADRDEVILVAHGTTDKEGLGFIILEWDGCEINYLFLAVLRDEDMIEDLSIYLAQ